MVSDIFHCSEAIINAPLQPSQCVSFFCQRFAVESDYDLTGPLHDESLPQKIESVFCFEYSRFVRHYQPNLSHMVSRCAPCSFDHLSVVAQYQDVVVVSDIVSAYAFQVMIHRIQQGYLVELIDLRAESRPSLAERIRVDFFPRSLIFVAFYDFVKERQEPLF